MKKHVLVIIVVLTSVMAFGQKKEIKRAEKAFLSGAFYEAKTNLTSAERILAAANSQLKAEFYLIKAKVFLADGIRNYENIEIAAEAIKRSRKLDNENMYRVKINRVIKDIRLALFDSALEDQKNKKYKAASVKLLLAYEVRKDTLDLYYAAKSAEDAKEYDTALVYYDRLLNMGYTGIKKEYQAIRIKDGVVVTFVSKIARDSGINSGNYAKPTERVTASARGDILKGIVLSESSRGNNENALKYIKTARAENPSNMDLVKVEADIIYRMGDTNRYDELIKQVIASDPVNPELYFSLAVSASSNGNSDKAIEFYEKALNLYPNYSSAKINIATVILSKEKIIIDEMNGLGMSKEDSEKYDLLSTKRTELFNQALPYLESALPARAKNIDLIRTLMTIYSQLSMDTKFKQMQTKLASFD